MRFLWLSLALVVVDQLAKWRVHTTMLPGESIPLVGDLLKLTYTTNPGMAFGLTLGSKLFLTLFSIAATIAIIWYLWYVRKGPWGYKLALSLVIGGALGNVIDRTFYGVLGISGDGTGLLFHGEVVDFVHVDFWRGIVPEWVPIWGGDFMALFPIWNVADMAIVVGVTSIILFQRRFHDGLLEAQRREAEAQMSIPPADADVVVVENGGEGGSPSGLQPVDEPPRAG